MPKNSMGRVSKYIDSSTSSRVENVDETAKAKQILDAGRAGIRSERPWYCPIRYLRSIKFYHLHRQEQCKDFERV